MHARLVRSVLAWTHLTSLRSLAMRTCTNSKCIGFGHIIFSVSTRCPLCRCDLRRTLPASEISSAPKPAEGLTATN